MTIGERLQKIRKDKGLSQKAVADVLGVSVQTVSVYENGKRTPKPETVQRFADALGVEAWELLGFRLVDDDMLDPPPEIKARMLEIMDKDGNIAIDYSTPEGYRLFARVLGLDGSLDDGEQELLLAYSRLNEDGKSVAIDRVYELCEIPKYQADSLQNSPPATDSNET